MKRWKMVKRKINDGLEQGNGQQMEDKKFGPIFTLNGERVVVELKGILL